MWEYIRIPDLFNVEWPCVKSCLFPKSLAIPFGFYPPFSRCSVQTEMHLAMISYLTKAAFPENFTSVTPKHLGGRGKFENLAGKPHIIQDEHKKLLPTQKWICYPPWQAHTTTCVQIPCEVSTAAIAKSQVLWKHSIEFFCCCFNNLFFKTSFAKQSHLNIIWEQVSEYVKENGHFIPGLHFLYLSINFPPFLPLKSICSKRTENGKNTEKYSQFGVVQF